MYMFLKSKPDDRTNDIVLMVLGRRRTKRCYIPEDIVPLV